MDAPGGRHFLVMVVVLVVVTAIVGGIAILGPPGEARARRLDARRVADLNGITMAVSFYRQANGRMPVSLEELAMQPGVTLSNDPVSGSPYRYRVLEGETYEVCGTFDRASTQRVQSGVDEWEHGQGQSCFTRKATIPKE